MKRTLGLGFLLALFSIPLFGATNSHEFQLSSDVQIGASHLPKGSCVVSWSKASGSQVQLTIKTENNKTITVPARMVEEKADSNGLSTEKVNGVNYLQELHTTRVKFILQQDTGNANGSE
jgi:hypothetical protein